VSKEVSKGSARKLLALFEPDQYPGLVALLVAMVVTALLQTAGIASVMPFLAVVSNPDVITQNEYLARAYETLGFQSPRGFLVGLGVLFVAVMVISNAVAALTTWATVRIQWRSHERISARLLEKYLRAPYSFHLDQNSARLSKVLLGEVNRVISNVFIPFTRLLTRGISGALLVILLVWVDPLLAVMVSATIGGFYAAVYSLVRKKQRDLGEQESRAKTERFKIASEAFGGIKELKALGREDYFLARFRVPSEVFSRAHALNGAVSMLPRFALETLSYGGIVVVILYLLQTRDSLDQIFPLLAVYAFGANRLMPAVQEIFQSLTQVRFGAAALDDLHRDLRGPADVTGAPSAPRTAPIALASRIRLLDTTFCYAGSPVPALGPVSIDIPVNKATAFVGATGSGKTTLVDLLLGLLEPTSGEILIDDTPLDESTLPAWRRLVGYVPQSIFLLDASIASNIAFGVPDELVDPLAVREAAAAAHLDGFVTSLPDGYDTVVGERGVRLSGGQRQRIGIARALYHNPEVLILDEATSALDNVTEDIVMQAIRELSQRRTIILIAHRLTTVRECDVVFLLERGLIGAEGTYDDLVASSPTFRAMARA
jgi:ABC-type multidrug transport system fused ATPase/permease subunit